jgi:hypothetical protein
MAMGSESAPRRMDIAHCLPSRRIVDRALEPTNTMITCPQIVIILMPIKNQFRLMPSKMLNLLSRRRLLRRYKLECYRKIVYRLTLAG